jgi:hypothetical protein
MDFPGLKSYGAWRRLFRKITLSISLEKEEILENRSFRGFMELLTRFELVTSSLPRTRSTD